VTLTLGNCATNRFIPRHANRSVKQTTISLLAALATWHAAMVFAESPDSAPPKPPTSLPDATGQASEKQPLSPHAEPPNLEAFSKDEWRRIDGAVERALIWIASQQQADGSFPTRDSGQPAVTSLCIMAFLSAGHRPAEGPYGDRLTRAVEYALKCQSDDGLFSAMPPIADVTEWSGPTHAAAYNHSITGLMLGEVYGSVRINRAIEKALALTRKLQIASRKYPLYKGGWRYLQPVPYSGAEQSDMSATSWQIMFYRSAMNAGFDVPQNQMDEATDFVQRSFDREKRVFVYGINGHHPIPSRAVMGAGLLCLYLAGKSDAEIEQATGQWMLSHPFRPYNKSLNRIDRYHYGAYYCSQAAFQLGGECWAKVYRDLSEVLLEHQHADGFWDAESRDPEFGNVYTTALAVLSLTPPHQLLPIYQR
jgi:hypothetical protein